MAETGRASLIPTGAVKPDIATPNTTTALPSAGGASPQLDNRVIQTEDVVGTTSSGGTERSVLREMTHLGSGDAAKLDTRGRFEGAGDENRISMVPISGTLRSSSPTREGPMGAASTAQTTAEPNHALGSAGQAPQLEPAPKTVIERSSGVLSQGNRLPESAALEGFRVSGSSSQSISTGMTPSLPPSGTALLAGKGQAVPTAPLPQGETASIRPLAGLRPTGPQADREWAPEPDRGVAQSRVWPAPAAGTVGLVRDASSLDGPPAPAPRDDVAPARQDIPQRIAALPSGSGSRSMEATRPIVSAANAIPVRGTASGPVTVEVGGGSLTMRRFRGRCRASCRTVRLGRPRSRHAPKPCLRRGP